MVDTLALVTKDITTVLNISILYKVEDVSKRRLASITLIVSGRRSSHILYSQDMAASIGVD